MEKQHQQQQQQTPQQDDKYEQVPLSDASSSVEDEVKSRGVTAGAGHSGDYAPYPKVEMEDPAQLQKERQAWTSTQQNPPPPPLAQQQQPQGNPYVEATPLPPQNKGLVENVRGVLGRWGKKVGDATKRAEDFTGNVWQHLKTGPSLADTAMERLAQGTKVLAEGGYEKIFRQTFEVQPDEQLKKTFACYLSTTAGPVIGTLYLSSEKLAFCSDEPLAYQVDANKTEWSFYKVTLPLYQMKAVNASANRSNPAEKYIQVITTDNHEFWFMGFVNYDKGLKSLQAVLNKEEP